MPPFRNRKMTFLALAGKCGALGASGPLLASPRNEPANPTMPNPLPTNLSASRLVIKLIHRAELARGQQCLGVSWPGIACFLQKFHSQRDFRCRRHAPVEQPVGPYDPGLVSIRLTFETLRQGFGL